MVKYLIAAHGRAAGGIKESLEVLLGACPQVETFDAYVDEKNPQEEIRKRVEAVNEEDTLVMLSDLPGGSVNQIMMGFLDRPRTYLVTGASIALAVGLVSAYTDQITEEDLRETIRESRELMDLVSLEGAGGGGEDFFS